MTEQPTLYLRQRQNAHDFAAALGNAVVRSMAKNLFNDVSPPDTMEKGRVRAAIDESFPSCDVGDLAMAHHDTTIVDVTTYRFSRLDFHQAAPFKKILSTRSHRKSESRRRSLGSVRLRLR